MRRIHLTVAALLSISFAMACHGDGITTAPEGAGALGKFDKVWQDFDEHYAYFEYGHIDWLALRDKYRPQVAPGVSDAALAAVIGGMIGELGDYHANLTTPFGVFGPPPIPFAQHYAPALLANGYFATPLRTSGHFKYATLQNGMGYLYLGTLHGDGWGGEIDGALDALGNVPALIFDVRNNDGGNESIAKEIASRFYEASHVYRLARFRIGPGHRDFGYPHSFSVEPRGRHFAAPVALITNRFDGSASEELVLMLRIVPGVVTVGDTTLGLGSNPLQVSLSNGWTYRVPQSMQLTPDGVIYQWHGLPPAVPVAWTEADTAAGHDPYIDAALRELAHRQ